MICQYEVKITVIVFVLAIIAHYLILKYIPKKYFYDDIEIKRCKKVYPTIINITSDIAENETNSSCTTCDVGRINDIDRPYNNQMDRPYNNQMDRMDQFESYDQNDNASMYIL